MTFRYSTLHFRRLERGYLSEVQRIAYNRPKAPPLNNDTECLVAHKDQDGGDIAYLFEKSFNWQTGRLYAGVSKRNKSWCLDLKYKGHCVWHTLKRIRSVRFFRSNCVEIQRKRHEYLYIYFHQPNSLAYLALYKALHFLIVQGRLPNLELTPWLVE